MPRKRRRLRDECYVEGCKNEATVMGKCNACYSNFRYHISQGRWHLRAWAKKCQVRVARSVHMLEE